MRRDGGDIGPINRMHTKTLHIDITQMLRDLITNLMTENYG